MLEKLKKLVKRVLALIPMSLPQGMAEFDSWASDIISIYGSPDNDSVRFALATMIMHLGPTTASKSKEYFGRSLRKGAANQVAHQIMLDLKEKQKKEQEKAAAEATASDMPDESKH